MFTEREVNELDVVLKTCIMNSTAINSNYFTITSVKDETVEEIYFDHNHDLNFLPNAIGEKFPNLLSLSAWRCSLLSVSRDNFIQLLSLRRMALNENNIQTISTETFEDLTSLEWLFLDHNKIKTLDVEVFKSLHKLQFISLSSNLCVDKDFNGEVQMAEIHRAVEENCKNENDFLNDENLQRIE